MPNIKRANTSGITKSGTAISDVPDAPTIGTATDAGTGGAVSVTFTPAATGGAPTSYTATSNPGSITGTGASSPITVTGLTNGTSYTFTVTATNSTGSATSAASNSVSPTAPLGMYESIATVTVGSGGSSSVTFSSIPSTYTHLQLRYIARHSGENRFVRIRFNSNTTSSNYTYHILNGTGSAITSGYENDGCYAPRLSYNANTFGAGVVDILDYTNTNKYKTLRAIGGRDDNGSGDVDFLSGLFLSTAAISSIEITLAAGSYQQYSHFALYGIKGA